MEAASLATAPQRWRKLAFWGLIAGSITLTVLNWSSVSDLSNQLDDALVLLVLLIASEVTFVVGAALMVVAAGSVLFDGGARAGIARIGSIRSELSRLGSALSTSRTSWFGFYCNIIGATGTGLVLLVGPFVVLPPTAWGLAVIGVVDLAATVGRGLPMYRAMRRRDQRLRIRTVRPDDLDAYSAAQEASWGDDMSANRAQLQARFRTHPQGIFVAEQAGEVVAAVTTILLREYDPEHPLSWAEVSGDGWCTTHQPDGKLMYGVDLSAKKHAPPGVADELLLGCIKMIIGQRLEAGLLGGRMPDYHKYAHLMSAETYLREKDHLGRPLDSQVRMYAGLPGMKVVCVIKDYFDDPDSLDYGVLLWWDNRFKRFPFPRLIAWGVVSLAKLEQSFNRWRVQRRKARGRS